jgi:uncharacterized damage-inducible protein DinB
MYTQVMDFVEDWKEESERTRGVLRALTDASLSQTVGGVDDRTLGRIAWHITVTLPEMLGKTGLRLTMLRADAPMPSSAADIAQSYMQASAELCARIEAEWTDGTLTLSDNMYGAMWPRGMTLQVLIRHEIHHRAQMTILMRQAGLRVPGIYGPALEDWAKMGMEPPLV